MNKIRRYCIAIVWLVNGIYCKVLNGVPRHQAIVAGILGEEHAPLLTKLIGVAETGMAIWIVSRYRARLNVITQVAVIAAMNIMEFILVPDLLLWGRFNLLFAFLFILYILYNEFFLNPKTARL